MQACPAVQVAAPASAAAEGTHRKAGTCCHNGTYTHTPSGRDGAAPHGLNAASRGHNRLLHGTQADGAVEARRFESGWPHSRHQARARDSAETPRRPNRGKTRRGQQCLGRKQPAFVGGRAQNSDVWQRGQLPDVRSNPCNATQLPFCGRSMAVTQTWSLPRLRQRAWRSPQQSTPGRNRLPGRRRPWWPCRRRCRSQGHPAQP